MLTQIPEPFLPQFDDDLFKKIKVYSRLTVAIEDTIFFHKLVWFKSKLILSPNIYIYLFFLFLKNQSSITKQYDLLAIEPLNEKMINQVCSGTFPCDIITFNLSEKLSAVLKKANFSVVNQS